MGELFLLTMVAGAALAVFGADSMVAKPVAQRVNFASFRSVANNSNVSVAGRFSDGALNKMTTTDGGVLTVLAEPALAKELEGVSLNFANAFVEVIGAKEDGSVLRASTVVTLGEQLDVELWDEAVKMA